MKTTIDIPNSMMAECKKVIREQNVTFRSLVEEGLDRVLADRQQRKRFVLKDTPAKGGGFQPAFEDGDWNRIRDAIYEGRGS